MVLLWLGINYRVCILAMHESVYSLSRPKIVFIANISDRRCVWCLTDTRDYILLCYFCKL